MGDIQHKFIILHQENLSEIHEHIEPPGKILNKQNNTKLLCQSKWTEVEYEVRQMVYLSSANLDTKQQTLW